MKMACELSTDRHWITKISEADKKQEGKVRSQGRVLTT